MLKLALLQNSYCILDKTKVDCYINAEPEKVWQHCSNAAWKVNDLGGKLRAKGPHLSIYF